MKLLLVNACVRDHESRTLSIALELEKTLCERLPNLTVDSIHLAEADLQPINRERLAWRESCCDRFSWDDPFFAPAHQLLRADIVLIAAPYWDLSFPSLLKIWIENIYVRNLVFHYENDHCIGHLNACCAAYITTAGSYISQHDWGSLYVNDVLKTLGIPHVFTLAAEGLDLDASDTSRILSEAQKRAIILSDQMLHCIEQSSCQDEFKTDDSNSRR